MTIDDRVLLSCIIPARNEEGNIVRAIENLSKVLQASPSIPSYEIIPVDDNSTDSTGALIDNLAAGDSHVRPVHRTSSPGFGNAVKAGMREATGDIIVPFMGDLSDDPHDIPLLVEGIRKGYDIAYGSRFIEGGSLRGYSPKKMVANRAFNNLVRFAFGIPNRDITNAFKAYRKEVLDAIGVANLESSGFDLTVEIPVRAHILGFRSIEVPVHWTDRSAGEAKLKLSRNATVYGKRFLSLFFHGNYIALRDLFHFFVKGSWIGIVLALLFGLLILVFLFTFTGFAAIFEILGHVSWPWIFLGCLAILLSFLVRTWRWSVLLRTAGYVYPRDILFKCLMFGWFFNYLVPMRLGDIARGAALKTTSDAPLGMTLSTIVIERIMDMVTLALLLGVASVFFYQEAFMFIEAGAFILIAAMFIALFLIYRYDEKIICIFEGRVPSIRQSIVLLNEGLVNTSRNTGAVALSLALSFPVWLFEIGSIFFAARSTGHDLPFAYATIAGIVAFIAQALPLTPAGLGIHEATITGILLLFSVQSVVGMSIALIDHFARGIVIFGFGSIATIQIAFASRWYFRRMKE
ncbi:MAG TPA: flippase-like domain-containing protein [Methanoregulaceae archaeon]|nr:MAG: flippase-like domain-containing protein [Methanolinea sp.]HON82446.1 flippase-like domain-containing protein [Methanoregulaceae archaeon]HPD11399.1 flippase-like domain-containing protein [Methanoregulaceae archaeon]HRT16205.1 flippase-like domain-containing protein [Methanoregulaceae archaeon]HRU31763.1 flippase-like domain-containing protein [Methanoregulaceae archaeon]